MKKEPSNRSDYNFFTKLSTRWNDNDIYGHMNNIIYYALFDTAVNKWLIKNNLIDEKSSLNVAHIESKTPTPGDTFGVVEQIFSNLKRRQATE